MSGEFGLREGSKLTILEQRPQILVRLSFKESSDSKLSDCCPVNNMAISVSQTRGQNPKSKLGVLEAPILEVIFVL